MIEIEHVTKVYPGGKRALDDFSLAVETGVFGLVGPNGAGKTTLMRIIATLLKPTGGHVRVFGHDLSTEAGQAATRALLGYLPQDAGLHLELSVEQELDYMALLKEITDPTTRAQQVAQAIEHVGLQEARRQRVKTLSGGMKRRLGIAIALLGNPRLVIVDEPTAGLDPAERVRFRNLLFELAGERIVILSTHIIEDVMQICTRLALINTGRLLFQDTPLSLVKKIEGRVWTSPEQCKDNGAMLISTQPNGTGFVYRMFSESAPGPMAQPAEPSLEDAYLWLIQKELAA